MRIFIIFACFLLSYPLFGYQPDHLNFLFVHEDEVIDFDNILPESELNNLYSKEGLDSTVEYIISTMVRHKLHLAWKKDGPDFKTDGYIFLA